MAVIEAFQTAKEELGATILMVTHDAVAAFCSDRVIVLSDGQIMKELKRESHPREFMEKILNFMGETEGREYDIR